MNAYDPTRALNAIREGTADLERSRIPVHVRNALAEFAVLDEWMSEGNHAPSQWGGVRRGRPPLTEDGEIKDLPLHRHGTRTGYNLGCKCLPCRAANRGDDPAVIHQLLVEKGWA